MSSLRSIRYLATAVVTASAALLSAPVPAASAEPCPDVDVVFARGTGEPPGVGGVGQAFVDALSSRVGGKSVRVSPVNYEASGDFNGGIAFARTFVDGIKDAGGHIESTASNCPRTKMVLGGYSQGAAVAGFVTSPAIPKEVPQEFVSYVPQPLPRAVADHVAAVVLFEHPPMNSCAPARHPLRSVRCTQARPFSCAPPTTRFAMAHLLDRPGSRIPCTRRTAWSTRARILLPNVCSATLRIVLRHSGIVRPDARSPQEVGRVDQDIVAIRCLELNAAGHRGFGPGLGHRQCPDRGRAT